jgi:Na+-driven multidrug efflux pump
MEAENRKNALFETMDPLRALAVMALPTVASQMIILLYNLADTWFIGRTNDPCMIGASSLGLTVYLAVTALANVFGTGGGSLMARLTGEKRTEDARRVVSYSIGAAALSALAFFLLAWPSSPRCSGSWGRARTPWPTGGSTSSPPRSWGASPRSCPCACPSFCETPGMPGRPGSAWDWGAC